MKRLKLIKKRSVRSDCFPRLLSHTEELTASQECRCQVTDRIWCDSHQSGFTWITGSKNLNGCNYKMKKVDSDILESYNLSFSQECILWKILFLYLSARRTWPKHTECSSVFMLNVSIFNMQTYCEHSCECCTCVILHDREWTIPVWVFFGVMECYGLIFFSFNRTGKKHK